MKLLTVKAAPELLKSGEEYRIGWNHGFNCGEQSFVFHSIEQLEDGLGRLTFYIFCDYDGEKGKIAYEFEGNFCSGSGAEPVHLLEPGESCEDIPYTFYE